MNSYTKTELAVLCLDALDGLEYKHEKALLSFVKTPAELFTDKNSVKKYLAEFFGEAKANTVLLSLNESFAESVVDGLEKRGVTAVTCYSDGYPERLKNIDTPPLVLYAKGDLSLLKSQKTLGAVGSRKTLPNTEALLKEVLKPIAAAGVTLVTGSASGADKTVLSTALESGKVISVLTGGIDHVYPDCNRSIIERVVKCGLVVSEQPPDVVPKFWMFPVRNRIIAGLSDAVLIASGDKKSGARHTADFALNYAKQVYAFPYSVGITSGELCNELIKNGASLCDSAKDLLLEFGLKDEDIEEPVFELDEDEKVLYEAIKNGQEDMTDYCMKNNLKFFEIAPTLSSLEIQGLIVKLAGNRYKPVK